MEMKMNISMGKKIFLSSFATTCTWKNIYPYLCLAKNCLESFLFYLFCQLFWWLGLIVLKYIWRKRQWYNNVQYLCRDSEERVRKWRHYKLKKKKKSLSSPKEEPEIEILGNKSIEKRSKVRSRKKRCKDTQSNSGLNLPDYLPRTWSTNDTPKLSHSAAKWKSGFYTLPSVSYWLRAAQRRLGVGVA